ncbi:hypothetical protein V7O66_02975 [Methanolobus sp. ZRKC3]
MKVEFDLESCNNENNISPIHPQNIIKYIEVIIKLIEEKIDEKYGCIII